MTYNFTPKKPQKFECLSCDFFTCNKKDFDRHISTQKHQILTNDLQKTPKNPKKPQTLESPTNICECGNIYKHRQSLFNHKKKCMLHKLNNNSNTNSTYLENENAINFDTNVVLDLVQKNQEFQKEMFLEMQKQMFDFMKDKVGNNNSTNIMNNSNNKTFNLQFFLNETCKDAMNISDFVESVKLQVSDLENVGKVGYIEGISNIIIKNLKALDVNKRPVHCADQKREVMYVKDENTWEKEDENNKKLRKAIRMIAHKNICMLKEFREKYPDCEEYDSNKNSQYNKIVYESMGGKGDDDYEKDTKIIKKIAKNVIIDKSNTSNT
jgi:hypothetical protein